MTLYTYDWSSNRKPTEIGGKVVFPAPPLEGTKISGWQVEVAPPGNDSGGIYESYGRGWLIKPDPEKDKALKNGGLESNEN